MTQRTRESGSDERKETPNAFIFYISFQIVAMIKK